MTLDRVSTDTLAAELRPRAESPDPLFGEWFVCADGRAHYFLAGRCLCGSESAPTEEPVVMRTTRAGPGKGPAHNTASSYCAACMRRNVERWAGAAETA